MPVDPAIQTALVVIAIAASVQTLVMAGAVIGAAIAWKRLQADMEHRYRELSARVDEAVQHARHASEAVHRVSNRASDAIDHAGHIASAVGTFLTAPRNMIVAGAASLASLLMKWRRGRVVARRHG